MASAVKTLPPDRPIIPDWWCHFTEVVVSRESGQKYLATNFKEVRIEKAEEEFSTERIVEDYRTPSFGEFIRDLEVEGILANLRKGKRGRSVEGTRACSHY